MLDIIIPTYNAKDTIDKTLDSIKRQKTKYDFCVYLVNDKSDYNYDIEINKYSKYFKIKELKLNKNMGPGHAREYGIKKSNNPYIMFIDSDDYLYIEDAVDKLVSKIIEGYDLVISKFILDRDNKIEEKNDLAWLHGKIYKREFLLKNDIHFNNTRANEDNGFNRLVFLLEPKIYYLNDITYYYFDNKNSITRKDNRLYKFTGLEGYSYNMVWAINEAIKRGASDRMIATSSYSIILAMYYYYLDLSKQYDGNKILEWSKEIKKIYLKYKKYLTDELEHLIYVIQRDNYKDIDEYLSFNDFLDLID